MAGNAEYRLNNIEPYKEKKGEEYMNEKQLAHFTNILNNWKAELMQEVDRTVSHMKDEAAEYLQPTTIRDLVTKYSQFINFNIYLWESKKVEVEEPVEEEESAASKEEEAEPEKKDEDEESEEAEVC